MQQTKSMKTTLIAIVFSAFLAIFKGISGIVGDSYALIADAIESTTDIFSTSLLTIGLWFSSQPADENHPFGHGRAETVAIFIIVAFLIASASVILFESIQHILTPHKTPKAFTLVVLLIVVAAKEWLFRYMQKHSKGNDALEAEAFHQRSDAITSLAAFVGISISLYMGDGWESADDWAAIFAALIIYYNAWVIFRPAFGDIMDEDRFDDLRAKIYSLAEEENISLDGCFLRKMGSEFMIDLIINVNSDERVCQLLTIKKHFKQRLQELNIPVKRIFIEINC